MKKILNYYLFSIIVILFSVLFIPNGFVDAAAQCTGYDSNSPATVVSSDTRTVDFGNYSVCQTYCQGSCSLAGVCTYTTNVSSVYPNCALYCAAGYNSASGGYCIPSGAVSCGGAYSCTSVDIGGGYCQRTCQCTTTTTAGNVSSISAACTDSQCGSCNITPTGTLCQFSISGGSATFPPELCAPPETNPPSGVDVMATVWNSGTRTTAFASQLDSNGPVWVYSQAPYQISWGTVTNATSCTLNGTSVSASGGDTDSLGAKYTYPLGVSSITYTLSCTGSGGTTSDTVTLNLPPPPTNLTMSCPAPGTTSSFSWTAPVGYTNFFTRARNDTTATNMGSPAWDDNFAGTSKSFTTVSGNSYHSWVYTRQSTTGAWSDNAISNTVTCSAPLGPNLTASAIAAPLTATVGIARNFTATITNSGQTSTGVVFPNHFQVRNPSLVVSTISALNTTSALAAAGTVNVVSSNYAFPSDGSYSVRVCADNNASMVGVVTESNETDNCGAWTTITVSAAATANIKANGSDGPINIAYNGLANITWSSTGATSCSVSPTGWTGLSGTQSTGNLTSSKTYTVSCNPVGPSSSDSVIVNVQAQPKGLTVIKSGQGTIVSSPIGINCGSDCTENYLAGTTVVLTATPSSGRIFTGWGAGCDSSTKNPNGSGGTCTVNMSTDKSIIANFAVNPNYKEF